MPDVRHPPGSPAGGRFAPHATDEADVQLAAVTFACSACSGADQRCAVCGGRGTYDVQAAMVTYTCSTCNGEGFTLLHSDRCWETGACSCDGVEHACPTCDGTGAYEEPGPGPDDVVVPWEPDLNVEEEPF